MSAFIKDVVSIRSKTLESECPASPIVFFFIGALTIPLDTNPTGSSHIVFPNVATFSPISRTSNSDVEILFNPLAPIFNTAISVSSSNPTSTASKGLISLLDIFT